MDNEMLVQVIKEKFSEQKMTAEYKLQLIKIVELEDQFAKSFSQAQWKEYIDLEFEKGGLQTIEIDQLILFVIEFLCN